MSTNALFLSRLLLRERRALMGHVRALIGRDDVEDVAQALWLKIQAVDDEPPIANKRAFLYRMARNIAIDMARSAGARERRFLTGAPLPSDVAAPLPSAETILLDREALRRLTAALAELSPRCQDVVRLHRIEGVAIADIAVRFGISRQMVGRYVAQAMAHCYARLEDENWPAPVSK